jgi:hypothetical protein
MLHGEFSCCRHALNVGRVDSASHCQCDIITAAEPCQAIALFCRLRLVRTNSGAACGYGSAFLLLSECAACTGSAVVIKFPLPAANACSDCRRRPCTHCDFGIVQTLALAALASATSSGSIISPVPGLTIGTVKPWDVLPCAVSLDTGETPTPSRVRTLPRAARLALVTNALCIVACDYVVEVLRSSFLQSLTRARLLPVEQAESSCLLGQVQRPILRSLTRALVSAVGVVDNCNNRRCQVLQQPMHRGETSGVCSA